MGNHSFAIPVTSWKRRFDAPLDKVRGPSKKPGLLGILKIAPMIARLVRRSIQQRDSGFDPVNLRRGSGFDPYNGVPLGGIGAGSIGRGWRGDFRRWQLRPGYVSPAPVWADQFSLFVECEDIPGDRRAQVLFPGHPSDGSLSAWEWDLPAEYGEYRALFPRAWTTYEQPLAGVRLTCRQLSPVIAHNYQETSYPAAEFRWKIENTGAQAATVGIMFTFQNGMGTPNDQAGGHVNKSFQVDLADAPVAGVLLRHAYRQQEVSMTRPPEQWRTFEDPLAFAIAARTVGEGEVTFRTRFAATGDGSEVWSDFSSDGRLDNLEDNTPSAAGEVVGAALAVTVRVPAGESREVAFSLAWDMPRVRFGHGTPYLRRYTRFFDAQGEAAQELAYRALFESDDWEAAIEAWQAPYLNDTSQPEWYRSALMNELYYLVDGGTIWCYPEQGSSPDAEFGRFAYLEGLEYRMYNTYDVHFYASFALIQLWPKLELALQRDMAEATLAEYPEPFEEMFTGKRVPRKLAGAVPHDIGWPSEDPWVKVNGYFIHDVNDWKDLNPKLVLQVYRDYVATQDLQFVFDTWPAVEAAINRARRFDRDGDGLIENDGFPDQTYDVWSAKGPSAYCGGLWLACLSAGAQLAGLAGKPALAEEYRRLLAHGRKAYEELLWNGRYYNYDASRSRQHDSIMADQLAGQWYARACGLPSLVEPGRARTALVTIHDWNVQRFNSGQMGAVNGMRPDGRIDTTSLQSQEVWTGTSYAVAAAMIHENLCDLAFATAWGVCQTTYQDSGYWFQTPEAWDEDGNYRSFCYMRPLAIWAMQWALERPG